jgi:glutaconate CoA-transferase subunit A
MIDKQISIQEAIDLIPSKCCLAIGGMTLYRRPVALVLALLKHHLQTGKPEGLTLLTITAGYESDLLVGAGMISKVRTCYFGLEIFGLAPMFTYFANHGDIEILEETEASIAFGLRAQLARVGFMPGRGWIGTNLPGLRPDVQTIIDPYRGETLMAFPAIQPDVAIIHAIRSDPDGNAQIGKNKGIDEELSMTARKVILTTEELVPEIQNADLVSPWVHHVVLAPQGAAPTSCYPLYPLDGERILKYNEQVSDPESFQKYLERILGD